jgi:O-antigen/teichoic acid export membrane protein
MNSTRTTPSLRRRIIGASSWVLSGHAVGQVLRLGSNLIMTRLLVPDMFGIMAVANVLIVGLALFSDLGLRQNIVQSRRGDDPHFLNTVWTVQIIRGVLIWLLALCLAILIYLVAKWWPDAGVYAEPVLPYVIGALSINAIIRGFESTKIATANRNLLMGLIVRIEILSQLAGIVLMIIWAMIDRTIWALVIGSFLASITRVLLSHFALPGVSNKLQWDKNAIRDIIEFGKWVFLSSILTFLFRNGDRLILGGLISAKTLGVYSIAFLIVGAAQMVFAKLGRSVVFPALSIRYREQGSKTKNIYYKFRLLQDSAISFLVGFMVVAGGVIIEILYDDRYLEAGPMLQVLSLVLFFQRYALADNCYLAMGRPNLLAYLNIMRMVLLYTIVPAGFYFYALDGALWGIVLSYFSSIPASLYLKAKYGLLDIKKELITLPVIVPGAALGWVVTSLV